MLSISFWLRKMTPIIPYHLIKNDHKLLKPAFSISNLWTYVSSTLLHTTHVKVIKFDLHSRHLCMPVKYISNTNYAGLNWLFVYFYLICGSQINGVTHQIAHRKLMWLCTVFCFTATALHFLSIMTWKWQECLLHF